MSPASARLEPCPSRERHSLGVLLNPICFTGEDNCCIRTSEKAFDKVNINKYAWIGVRRSVGKE